ncbi:unnamed protein product, partial [Onchocerca ochengi]|uniref:Uncharacterized protein n=1 Tax=Onchocerca ochengi TaxID=42157 RepID=A0A182F075_ONCOC
MEWPQCNFNYNDNEELEEAIVTKLTKVNQKFDGTTVQFITAHRFSKYKRLLRATVWALRFIKLTHKKELP